MNIYEWKLSSIPTDMIIANLYQIHSDDNEILCSVHLFSSLEGIAVRCFDPETGEKEFIVIEKIIVNEEIKGRVITKKYFAITHREGNWVFMNKYSQSAKFLPAHVREIFGGCYNVY